MMMDAPVYVSRIERMLNVYGGNRDNGTLPTLKVGLSGGVGLHIFRAQ